MTIDERRVIAANARVRTGLARVLEDPPPALRGARVGLLAHPASVTSDLRHAADVVAASEAWTLGALFGPQHGIRGEKQDNMVESESFVDPRLDLPVHSLYGEVREPTQEMLRGLDVLLIDLQDVGVRVYTFVWTLCLAMKACREAGVAVVVLDRPNPIGGHLREGPMLREGFESFVGLHRVPLRHGLTIGELARLANAEFGIGCELEVVACEGWRRSLWHDETGLPWVLPSPNLPTLDSCIPYPGTVLLEGTSMSEGRGTTRPFELIGAPGLDPEAFVAAMESRRIAGCVLRPAWFEPTFQKHAGRLCGGVQLHVVDRERFRPVRTTVAALAAAREVGGTGPDGLAWKPPPYEYEEDLPPIDILWGSPALRLGIDEGLAVEEILSEEAEELRAFERLACPHLLYE